MYIYTHTCKYIQSCVCMQTFTHGSTGSPTPTSLQVYRSARKQVVTLVTLKRRNTCNTVTATVTVCSCACTVKRLAGRLEWYNLGHTSDNSCHRTIMATSHILGSKEGGPVRQPVAVQGPPGQLQRPPSSVLRVCCLMMNHEFSLKSRQIVEHAHCGACVHSAEQRAECSPMQSQHDHAIS